jgi:hypothetical protein
VFVQLIITYMDIIMTGALDFRDKLIVFSTN